MSDNQERVLSEEDQAKVDRYLQSGYNETERKPFRGVKLLVILYGIVILLSLMSLGLGSLAGH
ncbi:MAG TPA: DUF3094 family protein [Pseudomonadales bacterium]|nr:DUF3094 family protein [Pseudomonadales bacterium]